MRKYLVIAGILLINLAFSGEIMTITASNAVEMALRNDLQLKQSEQDVKIAEAQYMESLGDFAMPSISASGSYTYLDPGTVSNGIINFVDFTTGKPDVITNAYADNYSGSLSINKTLFKGFSLWNSLRAKQLSLDLARLKYNDKKREITVNTEIAFYTLFVNKENIRLTEELNKSLQDQVNYSKANFNIGNVSEYDLVRVQVLYQNNQPKLLSSRNSYRANLMTLCDSIGVTDYDNVNFVGNLYDYTNMVMTNLNESNTINLSVTNDINLLGMNYQIELLKIQKDITESGRWPSLNLGYNNKLDYKTAGSFSAAARSWVDSWSIGLSLSIPIDGWIPLSRTFNAVTEMDETIKKNVFSRDQYLKTLKLQVRILLMQLDTSRANIFSQQEGLRQAKLGLRMANDKYLAGNATALDLADAQNSYNQAQTAFLSAIFDYFSSGMKLKRMIGDAL